MSDTNYHRKGTKSKPGNSSLYERGLHYAKERGAIRQEAASRVNYTQKPRRALKESKRNLRASKYELRQAKRNYHRLAKSRDDQAAEAREHLAGVKREYKVVKKVHSKTLERTGGSKKRKVARSGYQASRRAAEAALSDNDYLEDIATSRQKIRQTQVTLEQTKNIGKYSYRFAKGTVKNSYGLTNRAYNLTRGKGFTRTPKPNRWEEKLAQQVSAMRQRLAHTKAIKAAKKTSQGARILSKPLMPIFKNPLSLKAYLIVFGLIFLIALFAGGGSPMSQDEFDLTDAWLRVSKIDREKSNDRVDYWTDIDEMMSFMNFKYGDYKLKEKREDDSSVTYEKTLEDIWEKLNGDKDHLKKMVDLYGANAPESYLKLSSDDLKEYQELLEESEEVGRYVPYQELANPFSSGEEEEEQELLVTKRFGYISNSEVYGGSILQAHLNQELHAVMSGKVQVKDKDVLIKTEDSEFTYKVVNGIRFKTGDEIKEGDYLGTVSSQEGQEVFYRKIDSHKNWRWVNVGFYLPKVKYSQTTSVISDIDLSGDVATRIKAAADFIKKYEPKATINGISAMLGNFWTESSITAKRAEGDYLAPPIGASASSWDDPNWLSMNGPTIYGGRYPNILRRGLGLGQWTDTGDGAIRHTLLLDYAKSKGKKWYDLELQIDFIFNGDNPYYRQVAREILTSNDDVATLTQRFLVYWEGNSGDKLAERQNNASQVQNFLKNPGGTRGGSATLVSSWNFPEEYRSKLKSFPSAATVSGSLPGNYYPVGQCTWYVANRLIEAGQGASALSSNNGNGQDWVANLVAKGWRYSTTPQVGAVVSTLGGFDGTYAAYGHVGYVEFVNPDGSFLVSECNYAGVQNQIHWRVCQPAPYYTFALPPR